MNHCGTNCCDIAEVVERSLPGRSRAPRQLRIAMYSHDTQGLGHVRRNLLLASSLARSGEYPIMLMLSGAREAGAFDMPPGVDCLTIPALGKADDGSYFPRSLSLSMESLIGIRRDTIHAAVTAFDPDLLIVDKVPLGAFSELEPSLQSLTARGGTRCVLGLREILDSPETVAQDWAAGEYTRAIDTYYDELWVYGDRRIYDPVKEYAFPATVAAKVRYTGYLDPGAIAMHRETVGDTEESQLAREPFALCVVGGGRDGQDLARVFLETPLPPGLTGLLVTGPLMDESVRRELKARAGKRNDMRVAEFVTEPCRLMQRAQCVIAMGGYNTVCEIMSLRKRALIVPRVTPRKEQLIRAQRLSERGVLDMLHPDDLTPQSLSGWLRQTTQSNTHRAVERIDMNGLDRVCELVDKLVPKTRERRSRHAAV